MRMGSANKKLILAADGFDFSGVLGFFIDTAGERGEGRWGKKRFNLNLPSFPLSPPSEV